MIHYHGTPCGGNRRETARFLSGRHCLIPFGRADDLPVAIEAAASFALDNGAFSIWKRGGVLDVEGYFRFVESVMYAPGFDWAIIPDVIGGTEKENAALIARWPFGVNCGVPVWHLHESLEWLRYLSAAYPRVALGSSGQWSTPGTPEWWRRMSAAMSAICDANGQPRCKLHGLRMLNPEIFTRIPFASADSTNAVRNGNLFTRFGQYSPMTLGQRQAVIADRIESQQSPPCFQPFGSTKEGLLFGDAVAAND